MTGLSQSHSPDGPVCSSRSHRQLRHFSGSTFSLCYKNQRGLSCFFLSPLRSVTLHLPGLAAPCQTTASGWESLSG